MTDAIDSTVAVYERLLAKAKESVVRDFAPENEIADVLVMRAESLGSMGTEFHYCFKLNGHKHEGTVRIPTRVLMDGQRALQKEIYRAMAEDIARFILLNGRDVTHGDRPQNQTR